ncbi:MAG TPA: CHAD domain-containing protein [Steroidobacteraceae bacterium]|nr:CHAD domain-containing protein [Steroidobacteraceae bacterium]
MRHLVRASLRRIRAALSRELLSDAAIHDVRTQIKQARAALRLLRPEIGRRQYARADRLLRHAARPLAEVRDAGVLLDVLGQLAARPAAAGVREAGSSALCRALQLDHREARRRLARSCALESHASAMGRLLRHSSAWPARNDWPALLRGVERSYRRARRACARARVQGTPANMHAWRKQTKYLWYQLHLLGLEISPVRAVHTTALRKLSELLGDDHDLALLRARIVRQPGLVPDPAAREALLGLIDRRSRQLERRALKLGATIHRHGLRLRIAGHHGNPGTVPSTAIRIAAQPLRPLRMASRSDARPGWCHGHGSGRPRGGNRSSHRRGGGGPRIGDRHPVRRRPPAGHS